MNKRVIAFSALLSSLVSPAANATPGEYWEVTIKTIMEGMPFQMPAMTQKVCIPKGGEKDPARASADKTCKLSDVKTAGNKTTWNARCERGGDVTTGSGEQTISANSYTGKMRLVSNGLKMNTDYSGKHIGGSCEAE